jgi:hypothetical protein
MRTVKKAARAYRESRMAPSKDCRDTRVNAVMSIVENASIAGVKFALRRISVEEELPKDGETVLVMKEAGDVSTAIYSENYFAVDFQGMSDGDVVYWRRIEL